MSKRPPPPASREAKKRQYIQGATARPRDGTLTAGMRGVLISCDVHLERDAIKESLRLFESLVDDERPPTPPPATAGGSTTAGDALAREIDALKQTGGATRRPPFSVAQTGCGGNVLIRFDGGAPDPLALVQRVMEGALASRGLDAPHVIRMIPVQTTCAATPQAVGAALRPLVGGAMRGAEGTYAVQWRRRCNTDVEKAAMIDAAAGVVAELAPKSKVDLSAPGTAVLTEVIKTICCVSVLPHWGRYHHYNLRALTEAVAASARPDPPLQSKGSAVQGGTPDVEGTEVAPETLKQATATVAS
ncbi:hypothetical protein AB1Y20_022995 [Prymnesium parvum]|uniref:THUMP domain-containing protein n=1 Tax=Prymnesium parvum TaxID=97485 RepID=A0AB34JD39_PRYPA